MARKNVLKFQVATAQSLSATFISAPTVVKFLDNVSYQINITTTNSVGTFSVQASNDYQQDEVTDAVTNAGTWADLPLGGGTPSAGAANDTILINLNQLPFNAIRVKYTSSVAGTGTCSIVLQARQIGG